MTKYTEIQFLLSQIQNSITDLTEDIDKAKRELKKLKNSKDGGWSGDTPELGDGFYFVSGDGRICFRELTDGPIGKGLIKVHNYFRTKEEGAAELNREIMQRALQKIADKLNGNSKVDWNNSCQLKYSIGARYNDYDNTDVILIQNEAYKQVRAGVVYCLSSEFLDTAIKELGKEELVKYVLNER